jgi:F0F1-type ATP synthase assembly protein I
VADNKVPNWGKMASVGLEIAVGVALGLVVGGWLDRRFGWKPWGTLIGAVLGLAGGMYLMIKEALRLNKD